MVDYPVNYKKPSLVEYIADYIIDTDHIDDWGSLELGELVACDIAEARLDYRLSEAEEAMLSGVLDRFIKETLDDAISNEIAEKVESAREWRDAKDSAINN